jgi:hypothetical protein
MVPSGACPIQYALENFITKPRIYGTSISGEAILDKE